MFKIAFIYIILLQAVHATGFPDSWLGDILKNTSEDSIIFNENLIDDWMYRYINRFPIVDRVLPSDNMARQWSVLRTKLLETLATSEEKKEILVKDSIENRTFCHF